MEHFRVGLVGCGGIAQVHGAVLRDLEGVDLAACADIRPERAHAFAETFGGAPYDSLEAMLDAERLDCLHICTPTTSTPPWPGWPRKKASTCSPKNPR